MSKIYCNVATWQDDSNCEASEMLQQQAIIFESASAPIIADGGQDEEHRSDDAEDDCDYEQNEGEEASEGGTVREDSENEA